MNTRRNNAQKEVEENFDEAVHPQAPQNPQVPTEEGALSNVDIRPSIHSLTHVSSTQVARDARCK